METWLTSGLNTSSRPGTCASQTEDCKFCPCGFLSPLSTNAPFAAKGTQHNYSLATEQMREEIWQEACQSMLESNGIGLASETRLNDSIPGSSKSPASEIHIDKRRQPSCPPTSIFFCLSRRTWYAQSNGSFPREFPTIAALHVRGGGSVWLPAVYVLDTSSIVSRSSS